MKRINIFLMALICFVFNSFAIAAEKPNLINNGDFSELDDNGMPTKWKIYASGNKVEVDKTDKPKGMPHSIKITITETSNALGSLTQKIAGLPKDTDLVLTAKVKSTHDEAGLIQVKLKSDGEETKRINSEWAGKEWKEIKLEFSTGDSSEVRVQCRFNLSPKAKGAEVWFADVKLAKKKDS